MCGVDQCVESGRFRCDDVRIDVLRCCTCIDVDGLMCTINDQTQSNSQCLMKLLFLLVEVLTAFPTSTVITVIKLR